MRELKPNDRLQTKYLIWVWMVFASISPLILMGLIPELGWTYVWIFLGCNAVWIFLCYLLIPPYFRSLRYQLTDEEIIVHKGWLNKVRNVVPYRTVTNVSLKQGWIDRRFGMGSLEIHTAGYSQQTSAEAVLAGLSDHEAIYDELMTALRRYRRELGPSIGTGVGGESVSDDAEVVLLRQILEELKALRAEKDSSI